MIVNPMIILNNGSDTEKDKYSTLTFMNYSTGSSISCDNALVVSGNGKWLDENHEQYTATAGSLIVFTGLGDPGTLVTLDIDIGGTSYPFGTVTTPGHLWGFDTWVSCLPVIFSEYNASFSS